MRLFEELYGINCNTPVSWDNPTDRVVFGPYLLQEMEEKMVKIRRNLKETQYRKKIFTDEGITHIYFKMENHV
jgi:hypothetical protein